MPRGLHNAAFLITVFVIFLTGCGGGARRGMHRAIIFFNHLIGFLIQAGRVATVEFLRGERTIQWNLG